MANSDLRKHDPYRNMQTGEQGVRPDFLTSHAASASKGPSGASGSTGPINPGTSSPKKAEQADTNNAAAENLKGAEEAATGGLYSGGDSLDSTRENEQSGGNTGFYKGDNKTADTAKAASELKKGNIKGALKKGGPLIGIIFVVFIVGGIMAGTQVFQPFALIAQFQEMFNSMHISADMRSERMRYYQLGRGRTNPAKGTIFGSNFTLTDKQLTEFKRQGITFEEDFNGTGIKVLKYDDGSGEIKVITNTPEDASAIGDASRLDTGVEGKKYGASAVSLDSYSSTNSDFRRAYNAGSMTWRGQFASWFGSGTNNYFKNNKLTRNLTKDFKNKKAQAIANGETGLKVVQDELSERTGTIADDGGGKTKRADADETKIGEKLKSIGSKFNGAANAACGIVDTIGAISMLVYADEALQILSLAGVYMESVNKTQAGYGDDTPINELTTTLNEVRENTNPKVSAGTAGENATEDNLLVKETVTTEKTAMQSAGIASVFDGKPANPNDPSLRSFNFSSNMKNVLGGIGESMGAFKACAFARIAASAISALGDGVAAASCIIGAIAAIGTGGVSLAACAPLAADLIGGFLLGAAVGAVIGVVVGAITPIVTDILKRDLITNIGGEDLGNALASAANMMNGQVHATNGGSLANEAKFRGFAISQQQVIAEDARNERETLSPFDITSKNTFMGTLMMQMMSLAGSNSLMNTITTSNSVVSSSLLGIVSPAAIAYNVTDRLPNMDESSSDYYGNTCPYLASIGAVGDSFCNPYMITDTSTINEDPVNVINNLISSGDLALVDDGNSIANKNNNEEPSHLATANLTDESDGADYATASQTTDGKIKLADTDLSVANVKINNGSDLAKYAKYCGTRTSMFGTPDQNIVSEINSGTTINTGDSMADTAANGAIGGVPIVGDVIDILQNATSLANYGYISGESCVAGNNVEGSAPNWGKAKTYQRFIEDQSWAESVGLIDKSAVSAYLEEYYQENPIDNTYEGQLARYSGLDKETVGDILDVIAYYNYIGNYDPSERYAFGAPVVDTGEMPRDYESENVMDGATIALETVIYADVRNRTYAI